MSSTESQSTSQTTSPTLPSSSSSNTKDASKDTSKDGINEARAAVAATLTSVGASYDTDLQHRVADLHSNSLALAKQEKELAIQTAALKKESEKWRKLADGATKQLNEFGDVQNWAEVMERDLLVLEETLRLVDGREDRPGEASGVNMPNKQSQGR